MTIAYIKNYKTLSGKEITDILAAPLRGSDAEDRQACEAAAPLQTVRGKGAEDRKGDETAAPLQIKSGSGATDGQGDETAASLNGRRGLHVLEISGERKAAVGGVLCDKSEDGAAPLCFHIPAISPRELGSKEFREDYGTEYAYYAGSMANAISSEDMVINLGKAGFMGSYGSGGMPEDVIEKAIDRIQRELPDGPYMFNLLHSQNDPESELRLVSLYMKKGVKAIEASAFIDVSAALVYYRASGLCKGPAGETLKTNRIIAKISREEVAIKFMSPPDPQVVRGLLDRGLINAEQAELAKHVPVADDVTVEADSGGHTDNRPLISLLPLILTLRDRTCENFGYGKLIRVGAAGGISTPQSALAAFQMGADYVVTGSVNQACVEAGTSDYVKAVLAETEMSDVVMAPSADMFESGARVQVIKKGTMFPMNAQKLYDLYTKYKSLEEIPEKDIKALELRIFKQNINAVWESVKEYFAGIDPRQIQKAEENGKYKMALVFRWYLGNSSRWATKGAEDRKMDMQIWCGQSMGAFNKWVMGSEMENQAERTAAKVALAIMGGAAELQLVNSLTSAGVRIAPPGTVPPASPLPP